MPNPCQQLKQDYRELEALAKEFDLEFQKAVKTGNLERAKELRAELEQKRNALWQKLWPFEALPQKEFQEQYESQKEIFIKTGILEQLSSGELGIKAIDNKEYAFPALQEVQKRMRERKEALKLKTEQGFNRLLIVPFGLKLADLIEKYKEVILKHHQEGRLLAAKDKPSDPDEPLELNESRPVWVWNEYANADVSGSLVYFPKKFSENHQGKTKQEILKEQGGFPASRSFGAGWNILLLEDLPNIPRGGKGKKLKGRKQLEAGQSPEKYLKALQTNPQYKNESGLTPEEQIAYAILHLEQTNQVVDDYSGKGSVSYQLGAYFSGSDYIPNASWNRGSRQAYLGESTLWNRRGGVRGRVKI